MTIIFKNFKLLSFNLSRTNAELNLNETCQRFSATRTLNSSKIEAEFNWSNAKQGALVGCYYYGYVACHIIGGSLGVGLLYNKNIARSDS